MISSHALRRVGLFAALLLPAAGSIALGASPSRGGSRRPPKPPKPEPGISWTTWGYDVQRTDFNPREKTLTARTIHRLKQRWSFNTGAVINTQPVLAADVRVIIHHRRKRINVVFVGNEHGWLNAIHAVNGDKLWSRNLGNRASACADIPDHHFGLTSAPVIDRRSNTIYVAGGDGKVYALDMSTGALRRGWPVTITGDPTHEHIWSALTHANRALYVAVASDCDIAPYHGRIVKINVPSHRVERAWSPVPGGSWGGAIWAWGGVSVDHTGHLFTGTGNVVSRSEHDFYAEHLVRLDRNLHVQASSFVASIKVDDDMSSSPVLFQASGCPPQLVVQQKHGWLYLYNRNAIGSGPMQIIQMDSSHEFIGGPAWSPNLRMVYVPHPHDSPDGHFVHGIAALRLGRHCKLSLAWQQRSPHTGVTSAATVAGGIVYYSDGIGQRVLAYNSADGKPLWDTGDRLSQPVYAAPMVINGSLYIGGWDGRLRAFSVPAKRRGR